MVYLCYKPPERPNVTNIVHYERPTPAADTFEDALSELSLDEGDEEAVEGSSESEVSDVSTDTVNSAPGEHVSQNATATAGDVGNILLTPGKSHSLCI